MKNNNSAVHHSKAHLLINPKQLWAIENELIDIPLQYRDIFWNELVNSYKMSSRNNRR